MVVICPAHGAKGSGNGHERTGSKQRGHPEEPRSDVDLDGGHHRPVWHAAGAGACARCALTVITAARASRIGIIIETNERCFLFDEASDKA